MYGLREVIFGIGISRVKLSPVKTFFEGLLIISLFNILLENRFIQDNGEDYLMSIDGTDMEINELAKENINSDDDTVSTNVQK